MIDVRVNILDQSPRVAGGPASAAVEETIALARRADQLGYYRYWVAEHHNSRAFASASPEILMAHLAARTRRIRVGSGGVLLGHYSPLKIAEQFCMLETLYPGRIDLGLGRAGGTDARTAHALHTGMGAPGAAFERVGELIAYLRGESPPDPAYRHVRAVPPIDRPPEIWILGTSPASARFAAEAGLPYAFGSFISDEHRTTALKTYHDYFRPSHFLAAPRVNLALVVVAAETSADAQRIAKSSEAWFVQSFLRGKNVAFPPTEDAAAMQFLPHEQMALAHRRQSSLVGEAPAVADSLMAMAEQFLLDELTLVTITASFADRLKSYELLAERLALPAAAALSESPHE